MSLNSGIDSRLRSMLLSDPERSTRALLGVGLILLFAASLVGSEFHPATLLNSQSLQSGADFFATFWPPRTDTEFLQRLMRATIVTVSIATVATVLAIVLAAPLAVMVTSRLSISSRGRSMSPVSRICRGTLRGLLLFMRSVPELIWALLFVGITGLGATAGIMGLLITNVGILAKNYAEIMESGEASITGNLLDNGSSRTQTLFYATVPECLPELLSYSIYRWECTLRTSVVLGFVGAGGLGQELLISIRQLSSPEVLSIILVFVVLVYLADTLSGSLRRYLHRHNRQESHISLLSGKRSLLLQRISMAALVLLVLSSFHAVDWQVGQWLKPSSFARTKEFVFGFLPPDTSLGLWQRLATGALETLSMAFAGTALACIVALLISYALFVADQRKQAVGRSLLIVFIRGVQIVLRSIPELVWAMLLIIVAGIGPFTGTLALFLASVGVLSRLYSECLENQDAAALENLLANGSRPIIAPLWSTLIQARSQLLSYSLYRWEHNLRAATLMGIVGAGGVGQELYLRLSVFQFDKVAACILVIVLMVALADSISHFLRHRYAPTV
ncbi:PhnE/PtxC family ABC transporter permease [Granulosicoccus antarcticus]|uniref:Phosphate-import permease protein PhnE n=1 Tax=Granulosicoccus antarcticus IMCC3135 TaxID=1192854 RepID=A0A2Z2NW11_9GAMM|nr:ABC transporter permease subunit [Granulosicoccus antarcticus]ASJ74715.1 Phosphate-import permease protein PhnE [Granulosicoccus antarcticus IMCC3135]